MTKPHTREKFTEGLPEIISMSEYLCLRAAECREEVYKAILRQILGREPAPEDRKDMTIACQEGRFDMELVAYKGTVIGAVVTTNTFTPETGHIHEVRFDPSVTRF